MDNSDLDILSGGRRALEIEIAGVQNMAQRLGEDFVQAVRLIFGTKGKVVVTGMGKSGQVALKIASTLASTGTPAFFLHPAEAVHGDLGMVQEADIVLALSNSGQTDEVIRLLGSFRRVGVKIISITGNPKSELARRVEVHLDASVAEEACPLGLAPTASTTAALAMGDALAVSLLNLRKFTPEDYALFHPGGSLGKKLVTLVSDIMDTGDQIPLVHQESDISRAIEEMQNKQYGMTAVVDDDRELKGVFSMGDFTRVNLAQEGRGFMGKSVGEFMTRSPATVGPDILAARALNLMETRKIRALIVVDEKNRPAGIIGLFEVLKAIDY